MEYGKVRTSAIGHLGRVVDETFREHARLFSENKNLWLIGGTAREVFVNWRRRILSRHFASSPKAPADVDFVLIDFGQQHWPPELAEFDLQTAETVEEYMNTRDLAINEILLRPDWLIYSKDAEMAADNEMYGMPSEYELNQSFSRELLPRTAMRSLNTSLELGGEVDLRTRRSIPYIRGSFQQFLQLLKAFRKGNEDKFVREMGYNVSAERALLGLYQNVDNFKFDEDDRKTMAYAKWVVEQEDADNNFDNIKGNMEMTLERIVREEIRRRLNEAGKMGYGPDSFENSNDEMGDPWSIDNIPDQEHDVIPTRNRKESFLADQKMRDDMVDLLWQKIDISKREIEKWEYHESVGDPWGLDPSSRIEICKDAIRKATALLDRVNKRFSGGKKPGKMAPVYGKGPPKGMYENKNSHTPPEAVRSAARRGLELRKKHGKGGLSTQEAGRQGIGSGVARATSLASGDAVSTETLRRMVAFFSRHRKNKSGGEDDAGYIAWLLWGGDPGEAWARRELAD